MYLLTNLLIHTYSKWQHICSGFIVLNSSSARSYGYRGRDARCNVYLLPTGETVYFVAAVVVLYNADEQMQRHYIGHTDDIKW